jgi:hypothetical protein
VKESNKKIASEEIDKSDVKTKAKVLKSAINDKAEYDEKRGTATN